MQPKTIVFAVLMLAGLGMSSATQAASCFDEGGLQSRNGTNPTSVKFWNDASHSVNIFWLNYQGQRVFYRKLSPGESYVQPTFVSHPWVVTTRNGTCLDVIVARGRPSVMQIQDE